MKCLVGWSSDGCSTMLGKKGGVAAKLQLECSPSMVSPSMVSPSMVTFHCPAHRLDLAIQDIAKKVLELRNPQCRKVANRRTNLYLRLNNSLEMPTNSISTLRKGRRAYNTQHYGGIRNQLRNSSQH